MKPVTGQLFLIFIILAILGGCTPLTVDPNVYLQGRFYTLEDGNDQVHTLTFLSQDEAEYRVYTKTAYNTNQPASETETLTWAVDQATLELTLNFSSGNQIYAVEDHGRTLRSQDTGVVFRQAN